MSMQDTAKARLGLSLAFQRWCDGQERIPWAEAKAIAAAAGHWCARPRGLGGMLARVPDGAGGVQWLCRECESVVEAEAVEGDAVDRMLAAVDNGEGFPARLQ